MTQVPQQTDGWRCAWYTLKNVECILRQHATLSDLHFEDAAEIVGAEAYKVGEVQKCMQRVKAKLKEELKLEELATSG